MCFVASGQVTSQESVGPPICASLSQVQRKQIKTFKTEEPCSDEPELLFEEQWLELNDNSLVVKGRLRKNVKFWQKIGASKWILDILNYGYCLPFISMPKKKFFDNHVSAIKHSGFVSMEIQKLLSSGVLIEVNETEATVCSPLSVVANVLGKLRLILDLRYVNQHLRVQKLKYEDIRTACHLFQQGDWFFKFDYSSSYHHIDISSAHTQFLGLAWIFNGVKRYFQFTVLPFGLASAPYVFTKIQKALVKYWQGQGIRIYTYLDDGAGAACNFQDALQTSQQVRQDIKDSGFVANETKECVGTCSNRRAIGIGHGFVCWKIYCSRQVCYCAQEVDPTDIGKSVRCFCSPGCEIDR